MRSHSSFRLLTLIIVVWHLNHHAEVAAVNYIDTNSNTITSPLGMSLAVTSAVIPDSARSAGDLNGDGFQDLIIGVNNSAGGAYVIFGRASGIPQLDVNTMLTPTQGIKIYGAPASTKLGYAVAGLGDVNGDDVDDVIVSGSGDDDVAYIIFGNNETLTNVDVSNLDPNKGIKLTGPDGSIFGESVCGIGDTNGDGVNDILIGAQNAVGPVAGKGLAYVIFGNKNGLSSMNVDSLTTEQGFNVSGPFAHFGFASSVGAAGDVNKDGLMDFMVGIYLTSPIDTHLQVGIVGVFYGRSTGISNISIDSMTIDQGFSIYGVDGLRPLGERNTLGSAGDVNGDGIDDIFIGQPKYQPVSPGSKGFGKIYIIYGKQGGVGFRTKKTSELTSDQGFTITGVELSKLGSSVTPADMNGDGIKDLIVGALQATTPSGASAGKIYVFFGQKGGFSNIDLTVTEYPKALQYYGVSGQGLGESLDATNDFNGDGVNDIVAVSTNLARVHILYGTNCDSEAPCSPTLHPICYASKGCLCGESDKFVQGAECVSECSEGYYLEDITCKLCAEGCEKCTNSNTCQSCKDQFLMQGTLCVSSCSGGYYRNDITCESCPQGCATCTNSNTCQSCKDQWLLQETSCVSSCSTGYIKSGNTCIVQSNQPGGGNTGGENPQNLPEIIPAESSNVGLIVGTVVGGVVLVIVAITVYMYKGLIIAKFAKASSTAKYVTSTGDKPAVQVTEREEFIRLDTVQEGQQSPHNPSSPESHSPLASPQQGQATVFFPQSTQTLQVIKVEANP